MLINAAAFVPLVLLGLGFRPRAMLAFFLAVLIAMHTVLGLICLLIEFAVARFIPPLKSLKLKRFAGLLYLVFAAMPWVGGLIYCAIMTFMP